MDALDNLHSHWRNKRALSDFATSALASGAAGLAGTGAVGLIGAGMSPKGHKAEGALRGISRTSGTLAGVGVGGSLGAFLGDALDKGQASAGGGRSGLGMGLGLLGGAVGGGLLGDKLGKYMVGGKPSYERSKEDISKAEANPRIIRRIMMGLPGILNPEAVGHTDSKGDKKEHSKQVNAGSRRALFTGAGGMAGSALGNALADHPLGGVLGGLAGAGVGYGLGGK